jgi:nitrogenase molybdenum-iron protein alpha chain
MTQLNLNQSNFLCREQRLGAITGYDGTAADLAQRSREGTLCNRRRTFTQCGTCASQTAICQVSLIQDAAVVNHAPLGCAGDFVGFNLIHRNGRIKRNLPPANAQIISSNLTEREAVFGGAAKLEEALRAAYDRFHPKALFVTASCAAAITGEDVDGVAEKLEQEFDIPIAAVHCEGFRSQVWATGFDAAYHAILRKIVKPPKIKRPEVVNVVTFWGNDVFTELFSPMGLVANPVVPFATVERLQQMSESAATVQMCPTLGTYLGAGLELKYGVPEVKAPPPYGIAGADAWLRALAATVGKTTEVEAVIRDEKDRIAPALAELRRELKGLKVCVAAGSIHGHSIACILRELGAEVVGSYFWHHDLALDNRDPAADSLGHLVKHHGDIPVTICNKQAYELVNYLRRLKPDLMVIRHAGLAVAIAKLGIPTFLIEDEHFGLGYRGIIRYGRKVADILANQAFVQHLAQHTQLPYTSWWLEQPPHAFLSDAP